MKIEQENVSKMWDNYALIWDLSFGLYRRADDSYRRIAVEKLALREGDTVLDLACGTGLNFEHIEKAVGAEGFIIGIDFSRGMLSKAKEKIVKNGWRNIDLIQVDAANFHFKNEIDGVVCTWAMVSIPNYRKALRNSVESLKEGKRLVILDFMLRTDWVGRILNPFFAGIFAATKQDITRRPWEDMENFLTNVKIKTYKSLPIFPMLPNYIASGARALKR